MKKNRPSVLWAIPTLRLEGGGPTRSTTEMLQAIKRLDKDTDCHIIACRADSKLGEDAFSGCEVHWVEASSDISVNAVWRYFCGVREWLRSRTLDESLVHIQGIWHPATIAAAYAAKLERTKYIVSARGMMEPWALQYRSIKKGVAWRVYQRRILSRATAFHATSNAEVASIRNLGFQQPILHIPNGVELPEPAEWPSDAEPRRALFLSRIHAKKGLELLLLAWRAVVPPGWRLDIVGGGYDPKYESHLVHRIHQYGLQNAVRIHPWADDAEKQIWFNNSELFVLPSYSENFGNVVAEAMAHGVPVITTRGTPWSGLVDRRCGWWVKAEVDELKVALQEATEISAEARREMGARGREWMKEAFSWNAQARQMIAAYHWVAGESEAPACVKAVD